MFSSKKLPYYGKYNSISSINLSEDKTTYLVKRYNNDGEEKKEVFEISNKNKNLKLLLKDYYHDVKEYLRKNEKKYSDYKEKKITIKKVFDINTIEKLKNTTKLSTIIATLLIIFSFFTTSTIMLYYIGLLILIPSSTGLLLLTDIAKELNINKFIDDYEEFESFLLSYETKLENENKKSLTEYNGLNKDKNKGNDLKLKKIRTLESKAS